MDIAQFSEKLNELFPELAKGFAGRQSDEIMKGKISLPQFLIMGYLYRSGEAAMSSISRYMATTLSASTGMVDRMIKGGLVERRREESDRRVVKIKLTEKGRRTIVKIFHQRLTMIKEVFGRLSAEERKAYLDILYKVRDILSSGKK